MNKTPFIVLIVCGLMNCALAQTSVTVAPTPKLLKNYNVHTSPLLPFAKSVSLAAEFGVADAVTVGPIIRHSSFFGGMDSKSGNSSLGITFQTFGIQSKYYFSGERFVDSWYAEGEVSVLRVAIAGSILGMEFSNSGFGGPILGLHGGYNWFWDNGFNLNVGVGALATLEAVSPSGDFNLGYAF